MRNINTIVISGNITRDIEFNPNKTIGKINVAVNESKKDATGSWTDYANYFDVQLFGKMATSLEPYLKKGKAVIVQGKLHQDRWEKDGKKNSRVIITAENISLSGNGNSGQQGNSQPSSQPSSQDSGGFSEDIPF